jgi:hypothetical protein
MINIYTSNTSEIIRNDFLRFSSSTAATRPTRRVHFDADAPAVESPFTGSLDDLRADMADDDGSGSFASYKSPLI